MNIDLFVILNNITVFYQVTTHTTFEGGVDELINILTKRDDSIFETFCKVVSEENQDLSKILVADYSGEIMHLSTRKIFMLVMVVV